MNFWRYVPCHVLQLVMHVVQFLPRPFQSNCFIMVSRCVSCTAVATGHGASKTTVLY